ncbi:arginase family protein [Leifsonia sp. F6_8S_P_1B]|uniref:Arginase family protein n=1 Tax=Leifsonia williamsii TaxID=3035919 RepID=A0ABT8K729_9MICO|nr:arginase family protein [Leifsonia williamsii]MDN4612823.1 arginase family protein [Leifsonia williamsii]
MTGRVHVIGAATSAGAHGPGQELAPAAFRRYGLLAGLAESGLEVVDHGDVVTATMRPDPGHSGVADVDRVIEAARTVSRSVQEVLEADPTGRVLVLGGDCTIQLGVIAGAKAVQGDSVALAYIDLDCDLTSPANGNGIADWMGVTHLLDAPDAYRPLSGIDGRPPLLTADRLRLIAADRATPYEQRRLDELGLIRYTSEQVSASTTDVAAELGAWADGVDLLSVHVDVDVLDQTAFLIAEEQRDVPGLSLATLDRLVSALMAHPAARVLTITEVNPSRPPDPAAAFGALNDLVIAALAR